jgi:DNA-binding response OmpR family regulator
MERARVLIIEDDPAMLRGLVDNFTLRGYAVTGAADGGEGLQAALGQQPDLLILDIMLPTMNGYEICRQIRDAGLDMPIIMLTAKGQEEDIVLGLKLGADDYVKKPFSVAELMARAEAFLRRYRAGAQELYRFGDCELHTGSARLTRAGREVELTPKEYRLLCYFVERRGRALTRDDIMRHVWGDDVLVTSRSVDRCVATLRSKIEAEPHRPRHVRTIRDIGYRFEIGAGED